MGEQKGNLYGKGEFPGRVQVALPDGYGEGGPAFAAWFSGGMTALETGCLRLHVFALTRLVPGVSRVPAARVPVGCIPCTDY
jgi:hypothetical protein